VKWIFVTLVALMAGAALAVILHNDPGYALMRYGPWSVEMSLAVLASLTVATGILGYWAVSMIGGLVQLPARTRAWRKRRRQSKANTALAHAVVAAAEGDYAKAERSLIAHVADGQHANIYYLLAARYASAQQAYSRVDDYIAIATAGNRRDRIAAYLTDGELKIAAGQYDQALSSIRQAREYAPANLRALVLLVHAYEGLEDWTQVVALQSELERTKALSADDLQRLEHKAHTGILTRAARSDDPAAVEQAWSRFSKSVRENENMTHIFNTCLKSAAEKSP